MENKLTELDVLVETHAGLERQGPGSSEITARALSFIEGSGNISMALDLGCGTGGQTMALARHISGSIIGVDQFADFIDVFNENAKALNLQDRVKGIVGSMDNLSFEKESFDLIWSEGAIDNIGFENGISYWHGFLKPGGYVSVTCPAWFTDVRPAEVEKFWADAGSGLESVAHNIKAMQKCGYSVVAAFALPEACWTEGYFIPREKAEKALLEKYHGNKLVEGSMAMSRLEAELYAKYKDHYGYAFFIGRKV